MNILHTFTARALQKNRMRTLVTVVGIVLSMALLTAVIEGAYSGLVYLRSVISEDTGVWHACFQDLDREGAEHVKEQGFVEDVVAAWQTVGFAARDPEIDRFPIFVDALTGDSQELIASRIMKGRMPENEHELILPSDLYALSANGELAAFEVGQTFTMTIGRRTNPDGEPLTENDTLWEGEYVADAEPISYKIVGIYRSLDPAVSGTGYRALTKGQGTGTCTVFFTVRQPYLFKSVMKKQTVSDNWRSNSSLMRLYGIFNDDVITMMLYGFTAVLVLLVMFGSISLIYNAFSISISERTRQFGILKSIGATKKQIRASVRYEALMLSTVGIPIGLLVGCAGIGITLWAIRDTFTKLMPDTETQMRLALHPVALFIAALVALVTVLLSAAVPARRAAQLQPIEAIRQSTDIKTGAKEVKTSKLTEKLFGFEGAMGAKNFKRNRKGYRATVLSLFMSIVLFISASSFCTYLTDIVSTVSENTDVDVFAYLPTDAVGELIPKMKKIEGVTRFAYFRSANAEGGFTADPALLTDASLNVPGHRLASPDGGVSVNAAVIWMDDETFRTLCRASGVDPEPYFSEGCNYGVLVNSDITESVRGVNNHFKYYRYDLFKSSALPASIAAKTVAEREGLSWHYDYSGETEQVAYYTEEYVAEQIAKGGAYGKYYYTLDPKEAVEIMPLEDALETVTYSFDAFIEGDNFCVSKECAVLLYPFSKLPERMKDDVEQTTVLFKAADHKGVRETLLDLFEDADLKYNAYVGDAAEEREQMRMIVGVVNVFAYGFIILISLIAAANVFNTISTNIMLRRREFAMLKSIGMTEKGMRRMLSYECVIYGLRALLIGLPVSVGVTYLIHRIVAAELERSFYMPWHSILIAVGSVFLVVFATMLYARHKLSKDNPIDALKNENL